MQKTVKYVFVITSLMLMLFACNISEIKAEKGLQKPSNSGNVSSQVFVDSELNRMQTSISNMANYSCTFDESLLSKIASGLGSLVGTRPVVDLESQISRDSIMNNILNKCVPTVEENLKALEQYEQKLQEMVDQNKIESNDLRLRDIKKRIRDAKTYFENELERLDNAIDTLHAGYDLDDVVISYYEGVVKPSFAQPGNNDKKACSLLGEKLTPIIKWVVDLIQIAVPVIIIIMTIIDFMGVILSGEDKNFKTAGTKFIKRLIVGVIIIFLPMLITFIIDLSGALEPYGVDKNELFCSIF